MNQKNISEKATEYIKKNKKELISKFVINKDCSSTKHLLSIFMAGAPGAGKTEFSKNLIKNFKDSNMDSVIRIDADEIREIIPGYKGSNSYLFQGAASVGVEKIHDYVLKKAKNFILDGTFSNFKKSVENIERSLSKNRKIMIIYIYQDPLIS